MYNSICHHACVRFEQLDLCRILLVLKPRPMKRLVALAAILLLAMSNFWCQCTSAPEFTEDEIVTCDEHVWLTTYPNLTSWNDNEAVSDSFLVSTSGVVNAASVVLDSSALMLDGFWRYHP